MCEWTRPGHRSPDSGFLLILYLKGVGLREAAMCARVIVVSETMLVLALGDTEFRKHHYCTRHLSHQLPLAALSWYSQLPQRCLS